MITLILINNNTFNVSYADIPSTPLSPERFQRYLGKFLFSRVGAKYRQYFRVKGDVTCGEKAPPIEVTYSLRHDGLLID